MEKPILELVRNFTCDLKISYMGGSMVRPHYHDAYEIYFQLEGKRYVSFNGVRQLLQPGDLLFTPPFVPHMTEKCEQGYYKRYAVIFSASDLNPIFSDKEISDVMSNLTMGIIHLNENQTQKVCDYLQMVADYHNRHSTVAPKLVSMTMYMLLDYINSLAQEHMMLSRLSDALSLEIHPAIIKAINYINNNYNNDITLDFISDYVSLSKSQFCNVFKSVTGITFIQYLNNYRTAKAQLLISQCEIPLHKIACATGFYSTEHMTRSFQKLFNMSPSQWRKIYRSLDK